MNLNDLRMSLKAALDNMWARIDARITAIEQGGGVTGVKGNAEASYRQGNVNLTPENIGAMQNPDTTIPQYGFGSLNDAPVGFSAWYGPGCNDAPFQAWASVLTMNFIAGYVQQIAFSWYGNQIAYRAFYNNTWTAWKYIALS